MNTQSLFTSLLRLAAILALTATCAVAFGAGGRSLGDGRKNYSGSNMECLIANDFYMVHFTAMQEGRQPGEATNFARYCQEVPAVGRTFLSIDLLDRDVRATPIALRVVEEEVFDDDRLPEQKTTLMEVPGKIYKNGTADLHVDIARPGHYALIATIGENIVTDDDRLRVPFSVGLPASTDYSKVAGRATTAIVTLFFAVMALIGVRTWRAYRPGASVRAG